MNKSSEVPTQKKDRKSFKLWFHPLNFSQEELVINPDYFPGLKIGDILEIYRPENPDKKLILQVGSITSVKVDPDRSQRWPANLQISVRENIASILEHSSWNNVMVSVVKRESVTVEFVELSFKDQFISRSDMWRLKQHLVNSCVYLNKTITFAGMRAVVKDLQTSGQSQHSGYIAESSKFIFRSRSARIVVFIQMSREMWDFAEDGELYFEKAANHFLPVLYRKWQAMEATHSVSLVLFSRTFHASEKSCEQLGIPSEQVQSYPDGRKYQDFFTVVYDDMRGDWDKSIAALKKKFIEYPEHVHWRAPYQSSEHGRAALGQNSSSSEGNVLESISLALAAFDKQYQDRDLTRTGQSLVIVTAGSGVIDVQNLSFAKQIKQRMVDHGIGCDMVSLQQKPPLHMVPLFRLITPPAHVLDPVSPRPNHLTKLQHGEYSLAHWIYLFFFDWKIHRDTHHTAPHSTAHSFVACARMPEMQYRTITDQHSESTHWSLPKSTRHDNPFDLRRLSQFEEYDDTVFVSGPNDMTLLGSFTPTSAASNSSEKWDNKLQTFVNVGGTSSTQGLQSRHSTQLLRARRRTPSQGGTDWPPRTPSAGLGKTARASQPIAQPSRRRAVPSTPAVNVSSEVNSVSNSVTSEMSVNTPGPASVGMSATSLSKKSLNTGLVLPPLATSAVHRPMNPFNYEYVPPKPSSTRRRWAHLFTRTSAANEFIETDPNGPHWKSLTEPASLPITSDYFPSTAELNKQFVEYPHTLALLPDDNVYQNNTDELLKELISQRLSRGYQLVLAPAESSAANNSAGLAPWTSGMNVTTSSSKTIVTCYLSRGQYFHKLTYDPTGSHNIEVKRYQQKQHQQTSKVFPYKYCLWHEFEQRYVQKDLDIYHQSGAAYNWNYADQLVCGYYSALIESIKYWSINLILVPADSCKSARDAINGFVKIKELIAARVAVNNKMLDDDVKHLLVTVREPLVAPGTGSTAQSPLNDRANKEPLPLDINNEAEMLAVMSSTNAQGLVVKERTINGNKTALGFVASEAVDWLVSRTYQVTGSGGQSLTPDDKSPTVTSPVQFSERMTRLEAIQYCQALVDRSIFVPITGSDTFQDGPFVYSLNYDLIAKLVGAKSSGDKRQSRDQDEIPILTRQQPTIISDYSSDTVPPPSTAAPRDPPVQKRTVRIELDRAKTDRYEWMHLVYDTVFDAERVYELQLQWLVSTGSLVADWITQLTRRAKSNNLLCHQVPSEFSASLTTKSAAPLTAAHRRRVTVPAQGEFSTLILHALARLDFVAYQTSRDRLVHRSGALFILWDPTGLLTWSINSTNGNYVALAAPIVSKLMALFDGIERVTADQSALTAELLEHVIAGL